MGGICCAPGAEDAQPEGVPPVGQVGSAAPQQMSKSSPRAAAPVAVAPAAAVSEAPRGGSTPGLSFDTALEDLEKVEQLAYGSLFAGLGPDADGRVGLDSAALRDFVATNTAIAYGDTDMALIQAGGDSMALTLPLFLQLVRDNAVGEGACLERFMSLVSDGDDVISAADCRTGLTMLKDDFGASADAVGEGRWEAVLDSVMRNADAAVTMEGWTTYCHKVGRIVRVTHAAKL